MKMDDDMRQVFETMRGRLAEVKELHSNVKPTPAGVMQHMTIGTDHQWTWVTLSPHDVMVLHGYAVDALIEITGELLSIVGHMLEDQRP
jgi:hypothetical protein